jgi:phosphoglycolate phosphatase-like HAD superfamily hydrolase
VTSSPEPSLVLWDIDHTLVRIAGVSREIYAEAFRLVTGQSLRELADMAGRTERAIIVDTLILNGVPDPESRVDAFLPALGDAASKLRDRIREAGERLPGAQEAIAALVGTVTAQSVVTGNARAIAMTKLEALDLAEHIDFEIGGYGEDGADRAVLVSLAIRRAERKYGVRFDARRVVVIGDTPHDIKGAHDNGVVAVGVATGGSSAEELKAAGADVVLAHLTKLDTLCHTLADCIQAEG